MEIRIEMASEKLLRSQYPELLNGLNLRNLSYRIVEEPVGFGPGEDLILVGIVFIWESIKSGVTWDIIKSEITRVMGFVGTDKLKHISVYVEINRPMRRYEVECSYKDENVVLQFPDGTQVRIEHPDSRD